ncbi:MAG: hypothetical protein GT600_12975 [Bacteroidales bacterium]|nr:hypothetical protein [Bacteroidales bacterium]
MLLAGIGCAMNEKRSPSLPADLDKPSIQPSESMTTGADIKYVKKNELKEFTSVAEKDEYMNEIFKKYGKAPGFLMASLALRYQWHLDDKIVTVVDLTSNMGKPLVSITIVTKIPNNSGSANPSSPSGRP